MVDFSVYGQPMARTAPLNESMISLPSDADLAAMGMTAQQFADLQNSIGNINLSNTPILSGPLDLIGGSSPYSRTINEFDYMVGAPLSNRGNPTSTLRQSSNDFFVYEGQKVRLVDNKTGQVIFEGAGPADAKKASDMAAQLTSEGGRKANWDIQVGPETLDTSMMGVPTRAEGSWMTVANENPNAPLGKFGEVLGTALPIAVSLIPGLQVLGPIASSVAAGGVGAALRGDNALKGAVMGGLSAAGGEFLGPVIKGAGVGAKAATAIGTGLGATAGGLATGQSLKNSLLGGVASGGLSYLGGELRNSLKGSPNTGGGDGGFAGGDNIVVTGTPKVSIASPKIGGNKTAPQTDEIVLTGSRANLPFTPAANNIFNPARYSGGENIRDVQQAPEKNQYGPGEEIIVTGQRLPAINLPMGSLQRAIAEKYPTYKPPVTRPNAPAGEDEIVVTARKDPFLLPGVSNALAQTAKPEFTQDLPQAQPEKSTIKDIANYLRLAGLGSGLLGGLLGGGSKGTAGGLYPGSGTAALNPLFSAKLPAPTLPGASGNFAVRPPSDFATVGGEQRDWNQYGFGPEASFFNYVPKRGYSHGGGAHGDGPDRSFAVRGPGDGRSDDIPAMLSDGEYVMDAETVSLLGNGSFEGGAKKLDEFRVNIRKHKGRNLAKGKFSANAKRPERYLAGGRI